MKKVFLLGDSIRLDYCGFVKDMLKDEAEVCYSPDNGRFTDYTYVSLPGWKTLAGDPNEVSVVHWNNGHWDCAHFGRADEPLYTVEEYARRLRRVYGRIRSCFPNARVIFATTTGVCEARVSEMANPRSTAEIAEYNRAAKAVMAELNVPVNDLAAVAATFPDTYFRDGLVHYGEEGSRLLAQAVADRIREML